MSNFDQYSIPDFVPRSWQYIISWAFPFSAPISKASSFLTLLLHWAFLCFWTFCNCSKGTRFTLYSHIAWFTFGHFSEVSLECRLIFASAWKHQWWVWDSKRETLMFKFFSAFVFSSLQQFAAVHANLETLLGDLHLRLCIFSLAFSSWNIYREPEFSWRTGLVVHGGAVAVGATGGKPRSTVGTWKRKMSCQPPRGWSQEQTL